VVIEGEEVDTAHTEAVDGTWLECGDGCFSLLGGHSGRGRGY
jgi:hypothetical protein